MKITVLVENTRRRADVGCEHGLSLHIQTRSHNLLFDMGASDLLWHNARVLGVDLSAVDLVVVSHGHNDHGGALRRWISFNPQARIYVQRHALEHYAAQCLGRMWNVGLEGVPATDPRLHFVDRLLRVDDGVTLFADVEGHELLPESNRRLFHEEDGVYVPDTFDHEQYLLVEEEGRTLLVSGCAHRGMTNILALARSLLGHYPGLCVSGFHLYDPVGRCCESGTLVRAMAERLAASQVRFLTCHCTGEAAYRNMKEVMGDRIGYLRTGDTLEW